MKLFNIIPSELFSVLASPNRQLYADALDVLYDAYCDNDLKITENALYSMLRSRLEKALSEANFEDEDIDEDEIRDISGRSRFLIRKLGSKGWFEKKRGENFEEYIIVPSYSSKILELLQQLRRDSPMRGYSYVFGTYSALKVANEGNNPYEKMMAVYSAYDNTQSLIKMLKTVYHNVGRFFQIQIEMQDINQVLASHYNDFGEKVIEAYIRPLKIKDSVPKYRVPIETILNEWLENSTIVLEMANSSLQDGRFDTFEACRSDLLQKIFHIKDSYERIESDFLDEIDAQVRRYTRATTQKIENLTNRDQNVRGNINYLLTALAQNGRSGDLVDRIQEIFTLTEQSYLSEKSLWFRKRGEKYEKSALIEIEEEPISDEAQQELATLMQNKFSKAEVFSFMAKHLGTEGVCFSKDLGVQDDYAYIMSLMAALEGTSANANYTVKQLKGTHNDGLYGIPQLLFTRKERK